MKIRYILFLLTVAFLLGSCATPKVAYFTDLKRGTAEQVLNPLEIRVRPEDKISILVNSKDPLLMNLFNLPIISRQIGTTSGTSNSQGISGYTINKDGDIDFPVLGHIHVAGMTREEIASYIKEAYYQLGETAKADEIMKALADKAVEYLTWYLSLDDNRFMISTREFEYHWAVLDAEVKAMKKYNSKLAEIYEPKVEELYNMYVDRMKE